MVERRSYFLNPSKITDLSELESTIAGITIYEKENNCNAGVLNGRSKGVGGWYSLVSESYAKEKLSIPVTQNTCEFYEKFFPKSYFEAMRKQFT